MIVQRYPRFIQQLQQKGAEIAVHSYQHINLCEVPLPAALEQLRKAIQIFERYGIEVHGFRCPYLGCSAALLATLPGDMFKYSSNEAVRWELQNPGAGSSLLYETLCEFYQGRSAADTVCVPVTNPNYIEIPVCVPDDLQLYDGLGLAPEEIAQVWIQTLEQVHQRGELFTLLFHPELASFCHNPFITLVNHAGRFRPPVWIARLRDISEWWREKSKFSVQTDLDQNKLSLTFNCSPRATILTRGLDIPEAGEGWDAGYSRLRSNSITVPANRRPFIGVAADVPEDIVSYLHEQGYILDTGDTAGSCELSLNANLLAQLPNLLELENHIERSAAPLVRYWRWPDGAKCALSITGDLDALSLMDYFSRLLS
jgi:peptidoglycan/xylan/chitin deacetylase (PgdA/CDA1 family)